MSGKYEFRYGDTKVDSDQEFMTGAQIKAAIKTLVPAFDPSQDLVLEGRGNDADQVITDDQSVDLSHKHGGPKQFFSRPPTNFGGRA
ncbi:hypothetical protein AU467_16760 [Mesorhizobium loti]|uniref:Multi-ubiquitin domain-containing protein n=1 Tax=Rhizobium loti TaxID=381 RepID=A0A101KV44_RHILI|nr:hypothetical protein AU467_16760 [Mesorhizobium loti]